MTTPTLTRSPCQCGDRAATECPGPWEPGCDLGANAAHVRVAPTAAGDALAAALAAPVEKEAPSAAQSALDQIELMLGGCTAIEVVRAALSAQQTAQPVPRSVMTDQQAGLLNQAHDMLLAHADEQRQRGNDSAAAGAECSADAVLKLAAAWAAQPVASIYITPGGEREMDDWRHPLPVGRNILYTAAPAPVALVPLTDEQMLALTLPITHDAPSTYAALCYETGPYSVTRLRSCTVALIRAVERAHGIKAGKDGAA